MPVQWTGVPVAKWRIGSIAMQLSTLNFNTSRAVN